MRENITKKVIHVLPHFFVLWFLLFYTGKKNIYLFHYLAISKGNIFQPKITTVARQEGFLTFGRKIPSDITWFKSH